MSKVHVPTNCATIDQSALKTFDAQFNEQISGTAEELPKANNNETVPARKGMPTQRKFFKSQCTVAPESGGRYGRRNQEDKCQNAVISVRSGCQVRGTLSYSKLQLEKSNNLNQPPTTSTPKFFKSKSKVSGVIKPESLRCSDGNDPWAIQQPTKHLRVVRVPPESCRNDSLFVDGSSKVSNDSTTERSGLQKEISLQEKEFSSLYHPSISQIKKQPNVKISYITANDQISRNVKSKPFKSSVMEKIEDNILAKDTSLPPKAQLIVKKSKRKAPDGTDTVVYTYHKGCSQPENPGVGNLQTDVKPTSSSITLPFDFEDKTSVNSKVSLFLATSKKSLQSSPSNAQANNNPVKLLNSMCESEATGHYSDEESDDCYNSDMSTYEDEELARKGKKSLPTGGIDVLESLGIIESNPDGVLKPKAAEKDQSGSYRMIKNMHTKQGGVRMLLPSKKANEMIDGSEVSASPPMLTLEEKELNFDMINKDSNCGDLGPPVLEPELIEPIVVAPVSEVIKMPSNVENEKILQEKCSNKILDPSVHGDNGIEILKGSSEITPDCNLKLQDVASGLCKITESADIEISKCDDSDSMLEMVKVNLFNRESLENKNEELSVSKQQDCVSNSVISPIFQSANDLPTSSDSCTNLKTMQDRQAPNLANRGMQDTPVNDGSLPDETSVANVSPLKYFQMKELKELAANVHEVPCISTSLLKTEGCLCQGTDVGPDSLEIKNVNRYNNEVKRLTATKNLSESSRPDESSNEHGGAADILSCTTIDKNNDSANIQLLDQSHDDSQKAILTKNSFVDCNEDSYGATSRGLKLKSKINVIAQLLVKHPEVSSDSNVSVHKVIAEADHATKVSMFNDSTVYCCDTMQGSPKVDGTVHKDEGRQFLVKGDHRVLPNVTHNKVKCNNIPDLEASGKLNPSCIDISSESISSLQDSRMDEDTENGEKGSAPCRVVSLSDCNECTYSNSGEVIHQSTSDTNSRAGKNCMEIYKNNSPKDITELPSDQARASEKEISAQAASKYQKEISDCAPCSSIALNSGTTVPLGMKAVNESNSPEFSCVKESSSKSDLPMNLMSKCMTEDKDDQPLNLVSTIVTKTAQEPINLSTNVQHARDGLAPSVSCTSVSSSFPTPKRPSDSIEFLPLKKRCNKIFNTWSSTSAHSENSLPQTEDPETSAVNQEVFARSLSLMGKWDKAKGSENI